MILKRTIRRKCCVFDWIVIVIRWLVFLLRIKNLRKFSVEKSRFSLCKIIYMLIRSFFALITTHFSSFDVHFNLHRFKLSSEAIPSNIFHFWLVVFIHRIILLLLLWLLLPLWNTWIAFQRHNDEIYLYDFFWSICFHVVSVQTIHV